MMKSEKARGGDYWIDKYMWFIVVLVWISRDDNDNDDNVDDDTIGCAENEKKKEKKRKNLLRISQQKTCRICNEYAARR